MARPKGIPSKRKGKTYEEIYGYEKAISLKKIMRKNTLLQLERFGHHFLGKHHTKDSKEKISSSRIGIESHRKGNNYDEEYGINKSQSIKKKMSLAKLGRKSYKINKSYIDLYGLKKAQEIKEKLSRSHVGQSRPHKKETIYKIKKARAKQVLPVKDTTIEVKIQNYLKQLGIEFFTHQYMKIEHGYQCDILIPSMNLVIECDGDYWHRYPIGREIDQTRTKELIEKGFRVLRIWEREIRIMSLNKFQEVVYDK